MSLRSQHHSFNEPAVVDVTKRSRHGWHATSVTDSSGDDVPIELITFL